VSVNPAEPPSSEADLSLVMPCFNEEVVVGYTIPQLLDAFESSGHRLQLVAVDNGSSDRTGEIIDELADRHSRVTPHRIEVNEGYGNGILQGFPLCTAGWIGMIPADGQVDAEDVVRLFDAVRASDGQVIGKVRRRFRMDGVARKVVSVAYNGFMRLLWPRLGSWDVNGNPKIFPRRILASLGLRSKGWLLDPELMALVWLLAEGGAPLVIIGNADLGARSGTAGALLSLSPGRSWVVIDAEADPPTTQRLAALLQGGVGLGLTLPASGLRSLLEGHGPLRGLPEDGIRRLGTVLVIDGRGTTLRCVAAHCLRPSERDGQGHVQRRPPAVLASWDDDIDRFEHFAWGITPELADRVDRSQADFEERQRDRATFLDALAGSAPTADEVERRVTAYLASEPERVPAPPREPATPPPLQKGLTDPHQH